MKTILGLIAIAILVAIFIGLKQLVGFQNTVIALLVLICAKQ